MIKPNHIQISEEKQRISQLMVGPAQKSAGQPGVIRTNYGKRKNNRFIKEGYIRQGQFWPGKGIVDLELHSILKKDYKIETNS